MCVRSGHLPHGLGIMTQPHSMHLTPLVGVQHEAKILILELPHGQETQPSVLTFFFFFGLGFIRCPSCLRRGEQS